MTINAAKPIPNQSIIDFQFHQEFWYNLLYMVEPRLISPASINTDSQKINAVFITHITAPVPRIFSLILAYKIPYTISPIHVVQARPFKDAFFL